MTMNMIMRAKTPTLKPMTRLRLWKVEREGQRQEADDEVLTAELISRQTFTQMWTLLPLCVFNHRGKHGGVTIYTQIMCTGQRISGPLYEYYKRSVDNLWEAVHQLREASHWVLWCSAPGAIHHYHLWPEPLTIITRSLIRSDVVGHGHITVDLIHGNPHYETVITR